MNTQDINRKNKCVMTAIVLCGFFIFSGADTDAVVPQNLLVPTRSDLQIYPIDAVIGVIGQGDSDDRAFVLARGILNDVQKKAESERLAISASERAKLFAKIDEVGPRKFRIGGGQLEEDGSTSFLFRFIGREKELAGELYLINNDGKFVLDDILTEDVKPLSSIENINTYVFTPYERFY
ncbi:MAG: hypothetical protein Ta2G_02460 [Termitinemataceae bacterium]|nr:MAG: hypothetical protein Ta2G_02460 [Termitinemataceae bacterium]